MGNTVGSQQNDIIIGTLLGDSYLERNGKYCRLLSDHSTNQTDYVKWLAVKLSVLYPRISFKERLDLRTSKVYSHCLLKTRSSSELENYFRLFYKSGLKVLPKNLPAIMSPQILAVWVMNDGFKRSDCNALRLNTQSFNYTEHLIIKHALSKLALESTIQSHKNKFVVYVPSKSMNRLRGLIGNLVIDSMKYKIA